MLDNNSIEGLKGLEQQIMAAAVESNDEIKEVAPDDVDFQFDSREESFPFQHDEESDNKLYDNIISKVLSNPRIDKLTLLQKFISKIEMESNMQNGGLASELSLIKQLMNSNNKNEWNASEEHLQEYRDEEFKDGQKHHSASLIEQPQNQLLDDKGKYEGA